MYVHTYETVTEKEDIKHVHQPQVSAYLLVILPSCISTTQTPSTTVFSIEISLHFLGCFINEITHYIIFPRASLVAQLVKNLPAMQETGVQSLGWEDPLEKKKAAHSSILAWRIPWTV